MYIEFELRNKKIHEVRHIYERFVIIHPMKCWIQYARFEESYSFISHARAIYDRAIIFFENDEKLWITYAKFENRHKGHAHNIYKKMLDYLQISNTDEIYKAYKILIHRKDDYYPTCYISIADVIFNNQTYQFELKIKKNFFSYKTWKNYLTLLEKNDDIDVCRETYKRAITNVPSIMLKPIWRSYIELWILYAVFEEIKVNDMERCRQVYKICIDIIPHNQYKLIIINFLHCRYILFLPCFNLLLLLNMDVISSVLF